MPWAYLTNFTRYNSAELVLAHVAEENLSYRKWYKETTNVRYNKMNNDWYTVKRIMDNGAFELGESMDPERLCSLGKTVQATHIVLPDYPGEESKKTFNAARQWASLFKYEGFKTVFVPQSTVGDLEDYDRSVRNGLDLYFGGLVDELAFSIIGVPNAYNCYKNKRQRSFARWHYLSTLPKRQKQLFEELTNDSNRPPIHMLGLLDGPNEIRLIKQLISLPEHNYNVVSWDSSAAVWYGCNGIEFDQSPTGYVDGKYENPVDFNFYNSSYSIVDRCVSNMTYINNLCKENWETKNDYSFMVND